VSVQEDFRGVRTQGLSSEARRACDVLFRRLVNEDRPRDVLYGRLKLSDEMILE